MDGRTSGRAVPQSQGKERAIAPHHKSNKEVEGDPDTGHGRGLPRRPDEEKLDARLEEDREEVGLPPDPDDNRDR
ncbi:hypothetical protein ACOZE3_23935 [Streptomyces cinereoruber]|uniref:hypothetical protein n=1 Tax=Streptomyces cinereoruber TaxID=67260 RepID=UPI003BF4FD4B